MSFVYRGLKAEHTRHIVTAEEIRQQLDMVRKQNPRITLVTDRPAQLTDEVLLDYAGFCGGEQFAGGTAEKQTLTLGSGMFIPGFEEQLVGANVGDEVSVKVMFPTEYHAENLAGKAAEFKCKIHEIRAKSSYELDDTFAREIGGCETFAQMQQRMAQSMQAYADDQCEMQLQDRLMRMAAETLEFEPTEEQIRTEVEEQIQNMSAQLAQQGLTLELYCQFTGTTEEALRADTRNNAIASLRGQAAIEKIVALEALEATDEEIGQALNVIARQNRMTVEQLKPYIDDAFNAAVIRSVLTSKVMRLIRDCAEITEKSE